jgi:hypothetical protein
MERIISAHHRILRKSTTKKLTQTVMEEHHGAPGDQKLLPCENGKGSDKNNMMI